jgi:hypothetical protein
VRFSPTVLLRPRSVKGEYLETRLSVPPSLKALIILLLLCLV